MDLTHNKSSMLEFESICALMSKPSSAQLVGMPEEQTPSTSVSRKKQLTNFSQTLAGDCCAD